MSSITKDHCVSFSLIAFQTELVSLPINGLCDRSKVDSMTDKFRAFCVGGTESKTCHRENLFLKVKEMLLFQIWRDFYDRELNNLLK